MHKISKTEKQLSSENLVRQVHKQIMTGGKQKHTTKKMTTTIRMIKMLLIRMRMRIMIMVNIISQCNLPLILEYYWLT